MAGPGLQLLQAAGASPLPERDVRAVVRQHAAQVAVEGRDLLVLVPDGTRTAPLPVLVRALRDAFDGAASVTLLVALGTHPPLTADALDALVGMTEQERGRIRLLNHRWDRPETFVTLGTIAPEEVAALSGGRLREAVDVRVNRLVTSADHVLVCGPVFPHEVVGFSGGTKYFFPGVSGPELIDLTHWLGALITSYEMIGTLGTTPVRALIDRAARLVPTPSSALSFVVDPASGGLLGLFAGEVEESWRAATELSARVHVMYVDRPFSTVLASVPTMYDELWVAAKGVYKTEPVVADGGEIVLYAPHLREVSRTHGTHVRRVGYHVRDYYTAQEDRFADVPRGVLAHSTHLRGSGTYDAASGTESPRVRVTLASRIGPDDCSALGLGYLDPATVDPEDYAGREDEGVLLVRRAGEMLYRLRP